MRCSLSSRYLHMLYTIVVMKHKKSSGEWAGEFILIGVILFALVILGPYFIVSQYHSYVLGGEEVGTYIDEEPKTALVLGSGLNPDGLPGDVLTERLDAGIELYQDEKINYIIVSGYYADETYDEPQAMKDYLVDAGVREQDIMEDGGGYDTLASCNRAVVELNITQAVVITQPGHIDRAIFLCRSEGMDAYGYPAEISGSGDAKLFQAAREAAGNVKAVLEVYLLKYIPA